MIDSHTHLSLGKVYTPWDEKTLLAAMDRRGITRALVSLLDVMEYGHQHQETLLPTLSEYQGAHTLVQSLSSERLVPLVWVRPRDPDKEVFFTWLYDHRQAFAGFKFHPFHSRLPLDHDLWKVYFDFAEECHWPIVIHTAIDTFSRPKLVSRWAEHYPVPIVLVHMGLYTDHEEAVTMMCRYPHVYGDTTWVKEEEFWPILDCCGGEKILFGSDALVGGENTYDFYHYLFEKKDTMGELFPMIMERNACRLFGLERFS